MEITMQELYNMIEDTISQAGYTGAVSGEEIYNEICDGIEGKENGVYIFMTKKEDDTIYEYNVQIFDEEFNLSTLTISKGDEKITINFD